MPRVDYDRIARQYDEPSRDPWSMNGWVLYRFFQAGMRKLEPRGHHADQHGRAVVQATRPADDLGVAAVAAHPRDDAIPMHRECDDGQGESTFLRQPAAGETDVLHHALQDSQHLFAVQASLRASIGLILSARLDGPRQASRHAASITADVTPRYPA